MRSATILRVLFLVALSSSAAGADIGTLSVTTTPGLREKTVANVIEKGAPRLASCARILIQVPGVEAIRFQPFVAPPDADNRASIDFWIKPEGKVAESTPQEELRIRGLFLDEDCARKEVSQWRFQAFQGEYDVQVHWSLRFETTADERKAQLKAEHAVLTNFCEVFRRSKPASFSGFTALVRETLQKTPGTQRVHNLFDAVSQVNPIDQITVLRAGASEMAYPSPFCPALDAWAQEHGPSRSSTR